MKVHSQRGGSILVPAAELAHSVGVHPESVASWAARRNKKKQLGGRNHLTIEDAETYINFRGVSRVARHPRGWPTIKAMVLDSGVGRQPVRDAITSGELRAVRYGKILFVHPEDAKRFMLAYKSGRPLPGWVMVPTIRYELGRSKEALNQWIRRNQIEVRRFLHPTRNRLTPYISERDADRYRAFVGEVADRHVGFTFKTGECTKTRVLALLEASPVPLTKREIAAALDISADTAVRVAAKLCTLGKVDYQGRGVRANVRRYYVPQPTHSRSDRR